MTYYTSESQVGKATQQLKELHDTFLRSVLSDSHIPDSHTVIPPFVKEKQKQGNLTKHELSRCLLHNCPSISESLMEFCTRHNLNNMPDTSEDCLYSFPVSYHHYFLSISPSVNYTDKLKTQITMSSDTYTFDGFILVSQQQLDHVPSFCFQQYGYNYCMKLEPMRESTAMFTVMDALMLEEYLFNHLFQLYDFTHVLKCLNGRVLFVPRFSKSTGMELLPLSHILLWTIDIRKTLLSYLETKMKDKMKKVINQISDGWIVTGPNQNPSSLRIDRLEWPRNTDKGPPRIIHFSSVFNESKIERGSHEHHEELFRASSKELMLNVSLENILLTGLYTDIVQHALLLPQLLGHILFHVSLSELESKLHYHFRDRQLLERALTHPSYSHLGAVLGREVKVTASNCGIRRPQVKENWRAGLGGDIKALVRHAESQPEVERLRHNEQLEFLGDAALEFLCSLHLYHMLPSAKLGQLASYRTLLVKNKHLAIVAQQLQLQSYLLVGVTSISDHHQSEDKSLPSSTPSTSTRTTSRVESALLMDSLSHINANTLESVLGAVYLDSGLRAAQQLTARLFFPEQDLYTVWMDYPPDPLQLEHPQGDRHLISCSPILQKLVELEISTGVQFRHIRLLAKAFTHSSMQYSSLVGGSYEKLEHLGDAVLQFLASDFVYRKFPTLHEGHLSLLRTTLVQNKQLAILCKKLGFDQYIRVEGTEIGVKILADVVESYLAALLLDKGLEFCRKFLEVCLFPKLLEIVEKSSVEDANTQLQKTAARLCRQLYLQYESPHYRQLGSSCNPPFTVGVYFKGKRLGTGIGSSLRDARLRAAESALERDALSQLCWDIRHTNN